MRISDWSSDVCSSDLSALRVLRRDLDRTEPAAWAVLLSGFAGLAALVWWKAGSATLGAAMLGGIARSEEHTSELQSLMRISYAVFCLKKKKNEKINVSCQSMTL